MRADLRPYWIKRTWLLLRDIWIDYYIRPRCEHLGPYPNITKPWYLTISGNNIRIGHSFTAIVEPQQRVEIGVWGRDFGQGKVTIGDAVLMSPGVRIACSDEITIGNSVMMANGVYVTDSDWHGLYDRIARNEQRTPVYIADNVWLGDGVKVLKGVSIGKNSVVAAGAIVTRDIPDNVVAAGNPAKIVKELDPNQLKKTRLDMYKNPTEAVAFFDAVDKQVLGNNSFWFWLWSLIYPRARKEK